MNAKPLGYLVSAVLAMTLATIDVGRAATWNWSFAGEAGTFTIVESGTGAGTYTYADFSVTSSAIGRPIGSVSGGQYAATGFGVSPPYTFNYDGTDVTQWLHSGINNAPIWAFDDIAAGNNVYFFGLANSDNDPHLASFFQSGVGFGQLTSGIVTVDPGVSPVPGPVVGAGLPGLVLAFGGALAWWRRRRAVDGQQAA